MTPLDDLIAAVESGKGPGNHVFVLDTVEQVKWCVDAWLGSLDAALRLHEALLPGWGWDTGHGAEEPFYANVYLKAAEYAAGSDTPARAWLLALLRALKTQEAGQ
jgi:hypothetical protein